MEEIEEAAKAANIYDHNYKMRKWRTEVGKGGVRLTAGRNSD